MKPDRPDNSLLAVLCLISALVFSGCSSATADTDPDGKESAPPAGVELADEVELPPA